jgi:ssDNA-binding replication factor A large subunit
LPIAEISPYRRNWVIQGRITDRTNIREFNRKDGGSGKVFKIDLVDLKSGDIQVNFWGEGADKFNYLQKGDVITLKGGSVKLANKRYNNTSSNYELHSESNTEVTKVDAAASRSSML